MGGTNWDYLNLSESFPWENLLSLRRLVKRTRLRKDMPPSARKDWWRTEGINGRMQQMCKLCGIWRMKDWSYAGLDGCRTGWIQNRMDAGQDGCRTGRIQYRMDALQFGCTTARMHYRNDAGQGWCSTGGMQDRMDARQDRQDWSDATSFSAALLSHWPIKLQNWLFSSRKKVHDRMHEKLDVRIKNGCWGVLPFLPSNNLSSSVGKKWWTTIGSLQEDNLNL